MYTVFLIGNIASGKSSAARYLAARGALHLDLDRMAKDLYIPGSPLVMEVADAFGWDVLAADGSLRTPVLAERAFATPEAIARLNAIVHPPLFEQLALRILPPQCCSTVAPSAQLAVVEVSAAASCTEAFGLADEVLAVSAPRSLRRQRALDRGMDAADFDRRADVQPSEDELCALARTVILNTGTERELQDALDQWLAERGIDMADEAAAHA